MGVVVNLDDARERRARRRFVLAMTALVIGAALLTAAHFVGRHAVAR